MNIKIPNLTNESRIMSKKFDDRSIHDVNIQAIFREKDDNSNNNE